MNFTPPPLSSGLWGKSRVHSGALFTRANKVKKRPGRGLAPIVSFALLALSLGAPDQFRHSPDQVSAQTDQRTLEGIFLLATHSISPRIVL